MLVFSEDKKVTTSISIPKSIRVIGAGENLLIKMATPKEGEKVKDEATIKLFLEPPKIRRGITRERVHEVKYTIDPQVTARRARKVAGSIEARSGVKVCKF